MGCYGRPGLNLRINRPIAFQVPLPDVMAIQAISRLELNLEGTGEVIHLHLLSEPCQEALSRCAAEDGAGAEPAFLDGSSSDYPHIRF